jgi:hypothetical protein
VRGPKCAEQPVEAVEAANRPLVLRGRDTVETEFEAEVV